MRCLIASFVLAVIPFPVTISAAPLQDQKGLQSMIDQAKPGETVTIPQGAYEGPIRIAKPLILRGEGNVVINSTGQEAVLTIESDQATVRDLRIIDKRINEPDASVVVRGSNNLLEKITIETMGTGVQLIQAHHNTLREMVIVGGVNEPETDTDTEIDHSKHKFLAPVNTGPEPKKGNGIHLDRANSNWIEANRIENMFDGIYVENSNANHMTQNYVEKSRYGYHFMGTSDSALLGNTGSANVTGAMLMETTRADVRENQFIKQRENPNSQGILLFDVTASTIQNNLIEGNRVGLFMEKSTQNVVSGNRLEKNFIGMQLKGAEQNQVTANQFIANVIQGQAQTSAANRLEGNYWDTMQGIDLDGDQHSDLPYEMNPFFLALTGAVPPYQLFFQSPGFVFLEGLFTASAATSIRDERPLMAPVHAVMSSADNGQPTERLTVMGISAALLALTILLIYLGVRQK
ncbi:right-handed parallel beta-helix repeat-containing protein [Brevibacillus ruminantium]|uniref:Right-handed parallel beta-helix repeat-containing protein n=1 Tax=Brevibacillus ruminantium TaxID=2950604 RepID=A0ABY4WJ31_9BACL|nr:NosD domain-containing protein [Brevibacillus ruminantium]USG65860.1 right-handed parallel beta-helix repeat-containing protein [Brevibacillus ruminantium]